ncbi:hypothetical protein PP914_gp080 [Arthrobacter phage Qui]|uniref:Uncharacterized protein n=1 Tax=Arthrobacter phage Qui TaxID=2603260 RepID=A0A5B8WFK0_9CAUD|nr:hypothetical protein PP914_gp080 [Arthrobacter phage Qui]QED11570.1 hypothetical protein SEA_QUI_80 [Arthrobacter phage Qui]QOC56402.1 hypothetical protein SEA_PAELLA_80 [Arthrobacter phage Paella]
MDCYPCSSRPNEPTRFIIFLLLKGDTRKMSGSYPDHIAPEIGIPTISWVRRSPDHRASRKARLTK